MPGTIIKFIVDILKSHSYEVALTSLLGILLFSLYTLGKRFLNYTKEVNTIINNELKHLLTSNEKQIELLEDLSKTLNKVAEYHREEHQKMIDLLNRLLGRLDQ